VFFIYIGFEDIANLTEEAYNPTKNIPRALVLSVIITSVIYILVAISVIALLPPDELAKSSSPLVSVADAAGYKAGKYIGIAALFATASTALITLISISRMLFGMARDGDMPRSLSKILPKRKTPWVAALSLFVFTILLLSFGKIKIAASISSFWILIVFIAVQVSLITLRYKKPLIKRPFRTPFSIGKFPILPFIGILISTALLTQFDAIVYYVGFGVMPFGVAIYFLLIKAKLN
jgi:APA family basic amino acid/polyamine antiporter